MNLRNNLLSTIFSAGVFLSPAVSNAKEDVNRLVYQLVGDEIVQTSSEELKGYGITYLCKNYNGKRVYYSTKEKKLDNVNYTKLDINTLNEIKKSPQCISKK